MEKNVLERLREQHPDIQKILKEGVSAEGKAKLNWLLEAARAKHPDIKQKCAEINERLRNEYPGLMNLLKRRATPAARRSASALASTSGSLHAGEDSVGKLYVGSEEVTKAYLGDTVVYGGESVEIGVSEKDAYLLEEDYYIVIGKRQTGVSPYNSLLRVCSVEELINVPEEFWDTYAFVGLARTNCDISYLRKVLCINFRGLAQIMLLGAASIPFLPEGLFSVTAATEENIFETSGNFTSLMSDMELWTKIFKNNLPECEFLVPYYLNAMTLDNSTFPYIGSYNECHKVMDKGLDDFKIYSIAALEINMLEYGLTETPPEGGVSDFSIELYTFLFEEGSMLLHLSMRLEGEDPNYTIGYSMNGIDWDLIPSIESYINTMCLPLPMLALGVSLYDFIQ